MIKPDVDMSLSEFKKTETNPPVFKQKIGRNKRIQTSCNRHLY